MTDDEELIARLRKPCMFEETHDYDKDDAADRIEELVSDIAGWISNAQAASGWASEAEYKLEAAEAKLAKAIDVITRILAIAPDGNEDDDNWHIMLDDAQDFITKLEKRNEVF